MLTTKGRNPTAGGSATRRHGTAAQPVATAGGGPVGTAALRMIAAALVCVLAVGLAYLFVLQASVFRFEPGSGGLRVEGLSAVRLDEVEAVFAPVAGRSLALVDVGKLRRELEAVPWVLSARVARIWPATVRVSVDEREAVAFLRAAGSRSVQMVDSNGVILDLRFSEETSLPVVTGIDREMPRQERLDRLRLFEEVMVAFAESASELSEAVSEVDVTDARNAVVLTKHDGQVVRLQMGDQHLRHRLEVFLSYIGAWRSEFGAVESVDLRFEKQVAVRPSDSQGRRG